MISTRYDKRKNIFLYFFTELKTYHLLFLSTNVTLSTLLILAVCRTRVIHELHKTPSSPWSICSSVVEHQSAESEGLRVDSSWGLRIFYFLCPTLVTRRKTSLSISRPLSASSFELWQGITSQRGAKLKIDWKKTIMGHKFRSQLIFFSLKINKKFSV